MKRLFKPLGYLIAAVYFLVDAVVLTIAEPLERRLARLRVFDGLRAWIASLRPYPTLALFMVPVVILEPVKPVAAYLTATGHVMGGLMLLLLGELLKLVLIERLFSLSRDKLLSIPAFAWCYDRVRQAREWAESLEAWRLMRRFSLLARRAIRGYLLQWKTAPRQRRVSWQSR